MSSSKDSVSWQRFTSSYSFNRGLGFGLDLSKVNLPADFFERMGPPMAKALSSMEQVEAGAISNPDEKRMVGHYWLRDAKLAPTAELQSAISGALNDIRVFASEVHSGRIAPQKGGLFTTLLVIGIGGSALGPQFVTQALGSRDDKLKIFFLDNTDPDGIQNVLTRIPDLSKTLSVVISKSGGTKETRNGQLLAQSAYQAAGLNFSKHCVAVTGAGSELDALAVRDGWLRRFPMWDWVGGRTSELSAVGLLPAALQGFDIEGLLQGAREMDAVTRSKDLPSNPAALLALMWFHLGGGRGLKDMVILPYKDRLELFSRYLQQLVMESLGKEKDLDGAIVNQGIAVYGNKGSTDQHAYVQQLREGLPNFFATFIEVLEDASVCTSKMNPAAHSIEVDPGVSAGDYLAGFYLGTRAALYEKGRESISIIIRSVSARSVGQLIALFERAVGLYASLINVNAYHQPGVEAGKKAAAEVLILQQKVLAYLQDKKGKHTAFDISKAIGSETHAEIVFKILQRLSANGRVEEDEAAEITAGRFSVR
jgi:glucose-6-phosphate isomerase